MKKQIIPKAYNLKDEYEILKAIAWKFFNGQFIIDQNNEATIITLLKYFNNDQKGVAEGLNLQKGILLAGKIGAGKSDLMALFQKYCKLRNKAAWFKIANTEAITDSFMKSGQEGIERYITITNPGSFYASESPVWNYCIDDLGLEKPEVMNFGTKEDVVTKVLYERYNLYKRGILTHATTNLSSELLQQRYANRLYSRIREMFNWIVLEGKDRRI